MLSNFVRQRVTAWLSGALLRDGQIEAALRPILERGGLPPAEVERILCDARANLAREQARAPVDAGPLLSAAVSALLRAFSVPDPGSTGVAGPPRDRGTAR